MKKKSKINYIVLKKRRCEAKFSYTINEFCLPNSLLLRRKQHGHGVVVSLAAGLSYWGNVKLLFELFI